MDSKEEIKNVLTKDSLDSVCRTCLDAPDVLHAISDVTFDGANLESVLNDCVSITIEVNQLPLQICEPCIGCLSEVHRFKASALNSNQLLSTVLTNDIGLMKDIDLEMDDVTIAESADDLCPECPTLDNLSYSIKRRLDRLGKVSELCAGCGAKFTINYDKKGEGTDEVQAKPELVTKASFGKICRICISEREVLHQIFDISHEDIPISDLLDDCISLKVTEDDKLPQHICQPCTAKLCGIYSFKKKCLRTETYLIQMIQHDLTLVQDEPDDGQKPVYDSDDDYGEDVPKKRQCRLCAKQGRTCWRHKTFTTADSRRFNCTKCSATFTLACNLKRHAMIHTGEKPHLCDYCGKGFIQLNSLIEHKRAHTGEKPYKCPNCNKSWSQFNSYKVHMVRSKCVRVNEVGPDEFECNECCNVFKSQFELQVHSCKESPLACRICGRIFVTLNALKIHVRTHKEPKQYTCTYCNEDFSVRLLYTRHMKRHRRTEHICNECGKGFANYSGLWSHSKIHNGDQPYSCEICGRRFSQAGSLKSHTLIHTGEKPYTCKECERHFTQPNHLKYHMRTHSGEKPYTCKYCGKSFSLNGTLTVHMRIHTGETPFVCNVCGRGFYDSSSMKKHRSKHFVTEETLSVTSQKKLKLLDKMSEM